ncbi:stevor PIR protein,putative [Plasmodium sp. DRC-Itaito]|nr:stevor PIR protein,putative [Plasmodium sp. DRC-Itaito]
MNTYYLKILLFNFLIDILVLPHNENCENSYYNRSFVSNNTQRTTIKSRLLAQAQNHNPHYHNDHELKEIIDKLNEEAIKKYQQTHEPYEQLKELVEKNGRKITGGHGTQPMSTTENDLLETYEEVFGDGNHIMLKSGIYPNDDEHSSSCECTNTNNAKLATTKGKDKYLKHLKHRCTRGICSCSVGSVFVTLIGLITAKNAAVSAFKHITSITPTCSEYASSITIPNMFQGSSIVGAIEASSGCTTAVTEAAGTAAGAANAVFGGCCIASFVLLILAVVLIILYIWLYRRRKRSLKHECKKHLCK